MAEQIIRKKFGAITVRHAGYNFMKGIKSERLIAGDPIIIEHEDKSRRSGKRPYYGYAGYVIRGGTMGTLGTAEFRELKPDEVDSYVKMFSDFPLKNEIKNRLEGVKKMIIFTGTESNVKKIGVATALTRRREKIARIRGADAIFCAVFDKKMGSILGKEKWIRLSNKWWIKFLK